MVIEIVQGDFSVCKLNKMPDCEAIGGLYFTACTDSEFSLVCKDCSVPRDISIAVESGWRAMRIKGNLDFSLVGVLAKILDILAAVKISVFTVSTYDTDYILVKDIAAACAALKRGGYDIEEIA
ncbi:MAG: ACT domain-containing protein [Clostridia bacterium]|nr:ACT domain-containing protein [Clostridia bacterium]